MEAPRTSFDSADLRPLVGIDVGDNSVGLASILVDADGSPVAVHAMLSVLHDGGKDGMASGSTGSVSRKAAGGAARRVRRVFRNRRIRSKRLDEKLLELGLPVIDPNTLGTYDAWEARATLLDGLVPDEAERKRLLSIAIRHMNNHRGWANAWVSLESYWHTEEPSDEFRAAVEELLKSERFSEVSSEDFHFQADLAEVALLKTERLRPRKPAHPGPDAVPPEQGHILGKQRRSDVVREWRTVCEIQRVPDLFEPLAKVAFSQRKPGVPAERVGNDWLPGYTSKKRASVASLEHQELAIRQTVANLAIRNGRERERLDVETQNLIVNTLMSVTDKAKAPRWDEIAEDVLHIDRRALVSASLESGIGAQAPILRSLAAITTLPPKHPVRKWWLQSSHDEKNDFIAWYTNDAAYPGGLECLDDEFSQMFEALTEAESEKALTLRFPSGRAAHCPEVIELLNREIERSGDTYVEARNRLFGKESENLEPAKATLDVVADHPTLQRVLPPVRRFLQGVIRERGLPERIAIEHVRNAFLGFEAKEAAISEQRRNQRDRERVAEHIKDAYGLASPTPHQIRRLQAYERQNGQCLYCGDGIPEALTELDHIVARAVGGNSTQANLAAVCRDCNQAKGKDTFALFAASGRRPGVTLEGALQRVDSMARGDVDNRRVFRLKKEMKARLKQTELDEPIDERALASTAYAAVDMRDRIMGTYGLGYGEVPVYPGRITQAARAASGIDGKLDLRPGV
ncbi:MAG: HNH endonuclease, partial [Promicromonosporaceae bacterium]|nr:HNH endonuclease [Promicromonosporaceae bacterium]